MSTGSTSDFRCSSRVGVRTPVVIYQVNADRSVVRARAWTDDLSVGGVKLVTENRMTGGLLYIRIMLPELKDKIIACEVVREDHAILKRLKNSLADVSRWCYGVQFIGTADEATVDAIDQADNVALGRKAVNV